MSWENWALVIHTRNLAIQKAEIRRITIRSQPRQKVWETLSKENPLQKRAGGVAHDVGPDFKPQYHKKKRKCELFFLKKKPPFLLALINYAEGFHYDICIHVHNVLWSNSHISMNSS
jgi:hypothetical protein